jgi:predicted pyridoxine 5'-phosphate oxidase superfamily flavin-nucleotide-binding protein
MSRTSDHSGILDEPDMLTPDMKRIIEEQRLGFVATASLDGTPNVSPKGTLTQCAGTPHPRYCDDRRDQGAAPNIAGL